MDSILILVGGETGIENVSAGTFKSAVEQLFTFLYHMRRFTTTDKDPFATPTVEQRLDNLSDLITSLYRQLEKKYGEITQETEKVTSILDKLLLFVQTYGPTLDEAKKDYEAKARKLVGDRRD